MKIDEAIETARQFSKQVRHLVAQRKEESRRRYPDNERIDLLRREAIRTSKRLRRLMGW